MRNALKIDSMKKGVPSGFPAIKPTLNDYTWEEIDKISRAELWDLYGFELGDTKTVNIAEVSIFGGIGKTDCFILGFNHNYKLEGKGISFQFGKIGSKLVSMGYFNMYNGRSNSGGWEKSVMRLDRCKNFFNALPQDLQAVIKEVTKYSDNTGGGKYNLSAITATKDKIFIPSAPEIINTSNLFNQTNIAEGDYQKIYEYYKSANSFLHYRRNVIQNEGGFFTRTPYASDQFIIAMNENMSATTADTEFGFVPTFVV